MTPIHRPQCLPFMIPFLAELPAQSPKSLANLKNLNETTKADLSRLLGARYPEFRKHLIETFSNRCCYCESPLGLVTDGQTESFRPRRLNSTDGSQNNTYWYLATDWRNLYLACPACNRNKSDRFPVIGRRAEAGMAYPEVVNIEHPLLLDPCDDREHPDKHLAFLENGFVAGRTERGRATVEILALNRQALIAARADEVKRFHNAPNTERIKRAEGLGAYAAVWRQMSMTDIDPNRYREGAEALIEQKNSDRRRTQVSTEHAQGLDNYRAVARYVERVRIENFGPINLLELDLSESLSSQAPCFAILGENGVGKSTVLRAIAMALSGKSYTKRLRLNSQTFLPPNAYKGEVRVSIVGQPDLVMNLRRNRAIEFSTDSSSSLVLAYGATRLLPKGKHKPKSGERHAKIDNLFDPFLPLTDPEKWLTGLEWRRLSDINGVLSQLLPPDQQLQLIKNDGDENLKIIIGGDPERRICELSDGYQSMLGMAVDIMQVMYLAYDSMESAQGVVLIDELGNHFHPAWRLRCVSALRAAFPRIQFIFSTHDPLCLRGLLGGEVAVLRRDRLRQIYAIEDLPPVHKLRVEQLLSSEHFGLRSTLDPLMEELIQNYEVLTAKGDRTPEEEERLDMIIQNLTDAHYLGSSRRERLALQLLDNEGEPEIPKQASIRATSLAEATVAKLKRLMKEITPVQGERSDKN